MPIRRAGQIFIAYSDNGHCSARLITTSRGARNVNPFAVDRRTILPGFHKSAAALYGARLGRSEFFRERIRPFLRIESIRQIYLIVSVDRSESLLNHRSIQIAGCRNPRNYSFSALRMQTSVMKTNIDFSHENMNGKT